MLQCVKRVKAQRLVDSESVKTAHRILVVIKVFWTCSVEFRKCCVLREYLNNMQTMWQDRLRELIREGRYRPNLNLSSP